MNGYHSIIGDHSLVCFDKKTRLKYIKKNKVPILNAFSDVVNDFYMQNKVSYKFYAKQWNWDFKYVKEFLHHLGFKITTSQGINKHSILELITPIKSSKYPEEIFGLAQKYFSPEVSPESLQKVHQKKEIISNTSEYFSPEVSPDFHQKSQLNKIKEYNKRNKRIYNIFSSNLSNDKLEHSSLFEKFWTKYRQFMKENPHLAVNLDRKKDAELIFKRLFQKIDIMSLLEKYFFKCKSLNQKVKAPKRFLKALEDAGFREDLEKFDPLSCVDIRQCEIYFDPASNNGSGKGKLIFVYEGQALSSEQVKSSINFTFPKNAAYHLKLFAEFRQYLLNVYDFKSKRKVNQYYQNFLNEIKDRR